jgi:hypothetical protein
MSTLVYVQVFLQLKLLATVEVIAFPLLLFRMDLFVAGQRALLDEVLPT